MLFMAVEDCRYVFFVPSFARKSQHLEVKLQLATFLLGISPAHRVLAFYRPPR